jgi:hypothetical protein
MSHKVVAAKGGFFAAPLAYQGAPEARASLRERQSLVRSVGLDEAGNLPGLTESTARRLARRLDAARVRNAYNGGRSTRRRGRRA